MKRKKGFFSISAVAKMFSVHQQTIRLYEKQGLIAPKRSDGNTRLFSEEDVNRLEEVIYLTHQLGINLAGVEVILKLKKQIKKMQKDMNMVFDSTQKELDRESDHAKQTMAQSAQLLLNLKREALQEGATQNHSTQKEHEERQLLQRFTSENWEIDYEE